MKKVALYVRVSTQEQADEGYSIGAQLKKLRQYSSVKDWTIVCEYVDGGYSGSNLERPEIQKLISDACEKKFDMVLVYKLDRLSRSQKDTLHLIEDIFHPNNVKFTSIQENFDTSTAFGMAMVGILSVFAQLERNQITERLQLGLEARAKEGKWNGGGYDPFGYDYIQSHGKKGAGMLVVNEYEATQVKKIFDMFEDGCSIHEIRVYMSKNYSNKYSSWSSDSSVMSVLTTPIVCGKIKVRNEYVDGIHEAIIDSERFQHVQQLLAIRKKNQTAAQKNPFKRTSLCGGLIFCGNCGARYYVKCVNSGRKEESKQLLRYYTCYSRGKSNSKMITDPNCKNTTFRVEALEEIVKKSICQLKLEPERFVKKHPEHKQDHGIQNKINELTEKRKKLIDLFLLDSFPVSELQARVDSINLEISKLEQLLSSPAENLPRLSLEEAREKISHAEDIFSKGSFDEQSSLIHLLIDKIIINDKSVDIHWSFE